MKHRFTFSLIFAALVILSLSPLTDTVRSDALIPTLAKGDTAAPFRLKTPSGETVAFQPGKKKAILVFWSAFCSVCREIIPDLNEVYEEHGREIKFLSVNVDGERFSNAVENFIMNMHVGFPVAFDAIVDDLFIAADAYGVKMTPTVFFLSEEGKILEVVEGDRARELKGRAASVLSSPSK